MKLTANTPVEVSILTSIKPHLTPDTEYSYSGNMLNVLASFKILVDPQETKPSSALYPQQTSVYLNLTPQQDAHMFW